MVKFNIQNPAPMPWPLLQMRRKSRGNKSRQNVSCEFFNSLIVSCSSPFNVRTSFGVVQCALHTGCVYTRRWWSLSERIFVSPCVSHSLYVSYSYVFNLLESIISRGFKGSLTRVFWKFAEIFTNECLSPVSTPPAISCSPVSFTPPINLLSVSMAPVNNPCHGF